MPSQFFGLTIASSALNTFNAAVNTTANNIANVRTEGYSRQQTVRQASQALKINQRYGSAGTGVETTAIKRVRDAYYDVKFWNNSSRVGLYDTRLYYSKQVEDYLIDDDSMDGFSTILTNMFNALDSVKNSANNDDARKAFVSKSQNLMDYFNSLSTGYEKIQDSCNQEIANKVANINSIAQEVATLNKQINLQELAGGYANELRDRRDLLVDELSGIIPVEVSETKVSNSNYPETYLGGTDYSLKINGQTLVSSFEYDTLECVAREFKVNQSDIEGLFDVVWSGTNRALVTVGGATSGSLRASFEMRDGNNGEQFNGNVRDAVNDSSGTGAI